MSNNALTGGSIPIRLNGTLYNVSPLDDKDTSELDQYVRFIHMETATAAAEKADVRVAQMIVAAAVGQASALSFMSPQGAAIIKSVDGIARILWHGLKHNHPDLTHEQVRALMFNSHENRKEANRVFEELNVKPLESLVQSGKSLAAANKARQSRKKASTHKSAKSSGLRPRK